MTGAVKCRDVMRLLGQFKNISLLSMVSGQRRRS
jgi:hypothetical protein